MDDETAERVVVELCGGPLDGMSFDVAAADVEDPEAGAAMMYDHGPYGAGGRAWYGPRADDAPSRWYFQYYSG